MVTKVGRRQLSEADILAIAGGSFPDTPGTTGQVLALGSPITNTVWITNTGGGGSPVPTFNGFTTAGDGLQVGSPTTTVAVDSTVIRTSGVQTIAGVKTFTSNAQFNLPPYIRFNGASANIPGYGQIYAGSGTLTYRDASGTDFDMIAIGGGIGGSPSPIGLATVLTDSGSFTSDTPSGSFGISGGTGISTSATGSPQIVTITNDSPNVVQTITLTGDVTGSGTGSFATVVGNDSHSHTGSTISALAATDTTSGTFASARISEVSVTQHEAALSIAFSQITGTVDADTLDGIDSTSFLRSDAADIKTAGTLTFNDSIIAGFGTSNDTEFFHNSSSMFIDLNSPTASLFIRDGATTRFTFGRTSGDFTATGDVTGNSDIRLKENLEIIPNSLEKVEQLTGYTYNMKTESNRRRVGVVAQEVEQVLPEAVITDVEGIKSVAYGNLAALLIEAVKELSDQVKTLKVEIEELK